MRGSRVRTALALAKAVLVWIALIFVTGVRVEGTSVAASVLISTTGFILGALATRAILSDIVMKLPIAQYATFLAGRLLLQVTILALKPWLFQYPYPALSFDRVLVALTGMRVSVWTTPRALMISLAIGYLLPGVVIAGLHWLRVREQGSARPAV